MQTEERVILITGSTRGIGREMARQFAREGYRVALHGLEEVEGQKEELCGMGVEVEYFGADLSVREEALGLAGRVELYFGRLDVLVNNAAVLYVESLTGHEVGMWEKVMSVNLTASFCTMKSAMGGMVERGWGRIINIASVQGKVGSVDKAAYVASKHGLIGLTRVAALELAKTGVTCNAVCPGFVGTDLVWSQVEARAKARGVSFDEAREDYVSTKQPSGTIADPEEVGEVCIFLCSDEARHFQGSALSVDGGWSAQ